MQVCGLEWSPQSTQLASGGNDNVLNIWEPRTNTARLTIERHCAAVKVCAYALSIFFVFDYVFVFDCVWATQLYLFQFFA